MVRVGRAADPLAFPPLQVVGNGRYDDPRGEVSTLYVAEVKPAAYLETLAQFRQSIPVLAMLRELPTPDADADFPLPIPSGRGCLPEDWPRTHRLGACGLLACQPRPGCSRGFGHYQALGTGERSVL